MSDQKLAWPDIMSDHHFKNCNCTTEASSTLKGLPSITNFPKSVEVSKHCMVIQKSKMIAEDVTTSRDTSTI